MIFTNVSESVPVNLSDRLMKSFVQNVFALATWFCLLYNYDDPPGPFTREFFRFPHFSL